MCALTNSYMKALGLALGHAQTALLVCNLVQICSAEMEVRSQCEKTLVCCQPGVLSFSGALWGTGPDFA